MADHRQLSLLLCALTTAVLMGGAAHAQIADAGVVTGRVYCADTQKPARFALVRLQPVEAQGGGGRGGGGFGTTGPDGSFSIAGVAAGEYFADVTMPGYIQPLRGRYNDLQQMLPAERDRLVAQLTRVSVAANQPVAVTVTIYRGATVSGAITYDDGSSAPGVLVQAFTATPDAATSSQTASTGTASQTRRFAAGAQTDDRGQFRLTGLGDGIYTVQATPRSIFPIFYGNTIEPRSAKRLELHAAEESTGVDIQIPAAGMHRVSGLVASQRDGHGLARTTVQLSLASGDGGTIGAVSGADGSFSFTAVPDGRFTAQAIGAYDPVTRISYSGQSQAIEVNGTDVTDLVLNLSPHN